MAETANSTTDTPEFAAECHGVKVPDSPFLTPTRIERINAARYEGQEIAGALAVVRPGDKVLEMGAGLGLVGAVIAKNAKPAQVVSFEANPNLMAPIRALYQMNNLQDIIEVRNEVLISAPDAPQTLPFHLHNSYLGSSLLDTRARGTLVDVPTASYAQLQAEYAPDVLLMDIEGGELEFLRHASLKGIRAIVIEFHPSIYGVPGMRECKGILERAGFAKLPAHCTRQVWTCVYSPTAAPPSPSGGWSTQVTRLENAIVIPATEQNFVQPSGVLHADGSFCPSAALWRNGRALTTKPAMPTGALATRKGTWLWGGVLWMHFGHFLVESMSRLWALDYLEQDIDGILFIPKRPRNGNEVLGFQHALIGLLGTDAPVVSLAAPEKVEKLIVPGQGFGLGGMIGGTDIYRAAIARRFATDIAPEGPDKLYVSRSLLPAGRGNLIGEEELEHSLEAEGYTIYHPQNHDIHHQIATYKAARKVIAAEGSSLHLLAMVADQSQDIAMIVRRPSGATKNIETHVARFTGKPLLSVSHLIRSWKPKGAAKPRMWKGELDMALVQGSLRTAGFVSTDGAAWSSLAPSEIRKRLGDRFEEVV